MSGGVIEPGSSLRVVNTCEFFTNCIDTYMHFI